MANLKRGGRTKKTEQHFEVSEKKRDKARDDFVKKSIKAMTAHSLKTQGKIHGCTAYPYAGTVLCDDR